MIRRALATLTLAATLLVPLATAAATCPPPPGFEAALARAIPEIVSGRLDNGLRFVLVPRAHDPALSIRVAYDVGARDEAIGREGVAHLFEHMMFKGGGRVPDGGHFRVIRDVGGYTNAITDYDTTQYWQNVPRAALERTLFLEAERMRGLRLSEANLANQRAAIREEGLGLENQPYVNAALAFGLSLFEGTPYAHSPLGTPESLASMSAPEAEAFQRQWYAPSNAVVVLVGGFETEEARAILERTLGAVPARPAPPERERSTLEGTPRNVVAEDPLAPFPILATVWNGVAADDPDLPAIAVLDDVLLGHPDARLVRTLTRDNALEAFSLPLAFRDLGLLAWAFVPRTFVSTATLRARIQEETRRLLDRPPDSEETCHSVQRVLRARLALVADAEGVGAALARAALFQGDPRAFEQELSAIARVEPDQLARVAERVFEGPMHTLEVEPVGLMRFVKRLLEWLPDGVGASLEGTLL
ncbi:MAG: insulinase family protein [bacterium]|nr:insulinase family protein [bacterium]